LNFFLSSAGSATYTAVDLSGSPAGRAGQFFFAFLAFGTTLSGYFPGSGTYLAVFFS
jgi:hypothetical protein